MNKTEVREQIEEIIRFVISDEKMSFDDINDFSSLNMDSISLVTIICLIEEKYHILLSEQNLFGLRNISDLIDIVYCKLENT